MTRPTFLLLALPASLLLAVPAGCGDDPPPVTVAQGGSGNGGGGTGGGAGGEAPVSGIVSTSSNSSYETDPQIEVASDGTMAIVWMGKKGLLPTHIGYTFSTNGGGTWSEPQAIASEDDADFSHPDVVADAFGNFRLTFLASRRSGQGGEIMVATANNSETFSPPVAVTDTEVVGFYDRPRIAISNTGATMIAYTHLVNARSNVFVAVSDEGDEWVRTNLTNGNSDRFAPYPCASQDGTGRVYVVNVSGGRVRMQYSDDLISWSQEVDMHGAGEEVGQPATCVGSGDELWVSYGLRTANYLHSIRVAHSPDLGATVDGRLSAHDTAAAPFFANHQLTVEPSGAVNMAFYAASGPGDSVGSFRRVRFTDADLPDPLDPPPDPEEEDVGRESVLVKEPVTFELSDNSDRWIGSGVGMVYDGGSLYMAYVDNENGESHIAFDTVAP